jgi:response regulator of citrate/malate metabolism
MAFYTRKRPDLSDRKKAMQRRLRLREERQDRPRRGSSGLSHEEIQETIDCFLEAFHSGMPTIKHVAAGLGIAESTANKRIIKLRREGLLPPSRLGENSLSK